MKETIRKIDEFANFIVTNPILLLRISVVTLFLLTWTHGCTIDKLEARIEKLEKQESR